MQTLLSVRNKLHERGIEATPQEVWECVLILCDQDRDEGRRMLDAVNQNEIAFSSFANLLAPEEDSDFIIVREKEYRSNPWDLFLFGLIGFLLGVCLTIIFSGPNK